MEDDRRVWPPGSPDPDPPWNPQLRRTVERSLPDALPPDTLPPSARLYGAPAAPRRPRRWPRRAGALLALIVAGGLVAGLATVVLRLAVPDQARTAMLTDATAAVAIPLPEGWRQDPVPPVTGFTSAARRGGEALVMARPSGAPADAARATAEAAELYSRLLLHGDTVRVVEDRPITIGPYGGHTRSLRAEYKDVVNRPAYLRVMLLTKPGRTVVVVGLLQPDETTSRQALDEVMTSVR
ncbi:hypothetical protein GCM10010404_47610 [Nonomuraea africana]|uniref:DUF1795 domain-containing protein n=1 Tax=Nonomuraea africana TaxID=46171 RepID=A0ABR9KW57_9ACTN|nr:hypothetical protein [Nonomuraea africana]MBE1566273.1 hypothetical protein [Nonomuraea africana]